MAKCTSRQGPRVCPRAPAAAARHGARALACLDPPPLGLRVRDAHPWRLLQLLPPLHRSNKWQNCQRLLRPQSPGPTGRYPSPSPRTPSCMQKNPVSHTGGHLLPCSWSWLLTAWTNSRHAYVPRVQVHPSTTDAHTCSTVIAIFGRAQHRTPRISLSVQQFAFHRPMRHGGHETQVRGCCCVCVVVCSKSIVVAPTLVNWPISCSIDVARVCGFVPGTKAPRG